MQYIHSVCIQPNHENYITYEPNSVGSNQLLFTIILRRNTPLLNNRKAHQHLVVLCARCANVKDYHAILGRVEDSRISDSKHSFIMVKH